MLEWNCGYVKHYSTMPALKVGSQYDLLACIVCKCVILGTRVLGQQQSSQSDTSSMQSVWLISILIVPFISNVKYSKNNLTIPPRMVGCGGI